jgi:hypothetical protein
MVIGRVLVQVQEGEVLRRITKGIKIFLLSSVG